MSNGLLQSISDNVSFVLVCVGVAAALFAVAYAAEKYVYKRDGITERILSTRKITMIGLFSAIAVILFLFEFPIPFIAPPFYELDFSEIPALVGAFAFGPVAGVMIEFCKVLLKLVIKGTSTAFVGDLANFVIGCSLVLPASIVYMFRKTKKTAVLSCISGSVFMTVFGTAFNGIYLLPAFSALFGMPMDVILNMGTEINGHINSITTFVCFAVAPMNVIKSVAASVVTLLIYKPLSPILKNAHIPARRHATDNTHTT
ncbi:MAG: ECF transporter S component [Lachnospiraceae bacterium]|nr:ECF transporter S component [Lachnospiraceae bacterium]